MKRDLLFLSLEDWDDIWRRNQFICAALAQRHSDMRIVFVGVPRHGGNLLRSGRIRPLLSDPVVSPEGLPNIHVTRSLRVGIERYEWGLRLNEMLYRRHIRRTIRRFQLRDPILWINPHNAYHLIGKVPYSPVIYDITDDWTSFGQREIDRRRTIAADEFLCRNADAVVVCSQRLREMKSPLVQDHRLFLIPNGVDAAHYASVLQSAERAPDVFASLPRPIYGYTGTIHADRIDLDLLIETAKLLDRGSLVLIGPSHLLPPQAAALHATGRIHLLPPVPYARIPEYMRAFDVSITPHRVTPFTESLNPIKLWEYLAAGKPIVSTDVAGFRDYSDHVRIAGNAAEFADALRAAAMESASADGPLLGARRQAEARRHSWDGRVDEVEAVIDSCLHQAKGDRRPPRRHIPAAEEMTGHGSR
jgi:glycosyltransferase involved in cell wall biosynthesis